MQTERIGMLTSRTFFINKQSLEPPNTGFPLLVASHIIPVVSATPPLTRTMNEHMNLLIEPFSSEFNKATLTTNTLTTFAAALRSKGGLVLFKSLDNSICMHEHFA